MAGTSLFISRRRVPARPEGGCTNGRLCLYLSSLACAPSPVSSSPASASPPGRKWLRKTPSDNKQRRHVTPEIGRSLPGASSGLLPPCIFLRPFLPPFQASVALAKAMHRKAGPNPFPLISLPLSPFLPTQYTLSVEGEAALCEWAWISAVAQSSECVDIACERTRTWASVVGLKRIL